METSLRKVNLKQVDNSVITIEVPANVSSVFLLTYLLTLADQNLRHAQGYY